MTIEKLMQNASLRDLKLMRSVLDAKIRELEAENVTVASTVTADTCDECGNRHHGDCEDNY